MKKYSVGLAVVNVNVKAEPEFRDGGLTSGRKEFRDKAVGFIKNAKGESLTHKIRDMLCGLDRRSLKELIARGDYLETWNFIGRHIFRL